MLVSGVVARPNCGLPRGSWPRESMTIPYWMGFISPKVPYSWWVCYHRFVWLFEVFCPTWKFFLCMEMSPLLAKNLKFSTILSTYGYYKCVYYSWSLNHYYLKEIQIYFGLQRKTFGSFVDNILPFCWVMLAFIKVLTMLYKYA